jgi:hypothetical protein
MSDPAGEQTGTAWWATPLDEWERMNADVPPIDATPLSEDEKRQLRARLDAPGGAKTSLEPREYTAWMAMTVIRSPEAIRELAATVRAESMTSQESGRQYAGGILHAIAWATGEVREGPITGMVPEGRLPTVSEMEDEERAAVRVLEWRQECRHPRDYVTGVEACLLWLRAGGDDLPW